MVGDDVATAGVPGLSVHRAADRFVTRTPGLDSRHCFSFGEHYNPANVGFGDLIALNDDCVAPGAGYSSHPHSGLDLVSWVVSGGLRHEHGGDVALVRPSGAQLLSTGPGVRHSEMNAGADCLRFVQFWLRAGVATRDQEPSVRYESTRVEFGQSGWVQIAGGPESSAPLRLTALNAAVFVGRLLAGNTPTLPVSDWVHLFVVAGRIQVAGHDLGVGDSARAVNAAGVNVGAVLPAEVLLVSAPPSD
jgi:hypothetical protein